MLPNFIIVGAPKAGTTSLYHYLSDHPQVFMSEPKEVNYFSKEEIDAQELYYQAFNAKDLKSYKKLFSNVNQEKAIGEGSVSYLFYPETPTKIKAVIPNAKIIILLRDPIERGYSHYLMDLRMGLVDLSYEDIVHKKSNHKNIDLYYQQYIELGLYYEQVKRYLAIFGSKQVKIYFQEDFRSDPKQIVSSLYDFLEIDSSFAVDTTKQHNLFSMPKNRFIQQLYGSTATRAFVKSIFPNILKEKAKNIFFERKKKPELDQKLREELRCLYSKDIHKLESLIERDLSCWYEEKVNE